MVLNIRWDLWEHGPEPYEDPYKESSEDEQDPEEQEENET